MAERTTIRWRKYLLNMGSLRGSRLFGAFFMVHFVEYGSRGSSSRYMAQPFRNENVARVDSSWL